MKERYRGKDIHLTITLKIIEPVAKCFLFYYYRTSTSCNQFTQRKASHRDSIRKATEFMNQALSAFGHLQPGVGTPL